MPNDNTISRGEGTVLYGSVKMMSPLRLITLGRFCTEPGPDMRDMTWLLVSHKALFPTDINDFPLEHVLFIPFLQTKRIFLFPHNALDTHCLMCL
jgi:hypothetical protein